MNWLRYWLRRALTRPAVFARAWKRLGFAASLKLVRIRLGSRNKLYKVSVPQWEHPVWVRGGGSTDSVVLYEILVTDEYDHASQLNNPAFILDVGANVGFAAIFFLNLYPGCRVVAVEPDPSTAEICRRNLAPYGKRAVLLQGAVWDHSGWISLQPNAEEFATSVREAASPDEASIQAFTIDQIMEDHSQGRAIDLLKVDVEGGERQIFSARPLSWLGAVRNIVIEFHGPECEKAFFDAMADVRSDMIRRDCVAFCLNMKHLAR